LFGWLIGWLVYSGHPDSWIKNGFEEDRPVVKSTINVKSNREEKYVN
jgi:hypothetical protein